MKTKLSEDVTPITDFRTKSGELLAKMKRTRRPLILTQHGRSTAVLLDVRAYEELVEHAELLHDIQVAEKQIAEGKFIEHSDFKKYIFERLGL